MGEQYAANRNIAWSAATGGRAALSARVPPGVDGPSSWSLSRAVGHNWPRRLANGPSATAPPWSAGPSGRSCSPRAVRCVRGTRGRPSAARGDQVERGHDTEVIRRGEAGLVGVVEGDGGGGRGIVGAL